MLVVVSEGKTFFNIRVFFDLECKAVDGIISSFWPLILGKICSFLLLPQIILIFVYWFDTLSRLSLMKKSFSLVVFFAANIKAMYQASINNKATIACFLILQLTRPLFSIKTKPKVDFCVAQLPAQSELKYYFIIRFFPSPFFPQQMIPSDLVAFEYLIIVLIVFMYWQKRFLANQFITKMANAMSDLVFTIKNIRDSVIP